MEEKRKRCRGRRTGTAMGRMRVQSPALTAGLTSPLRAEMDDMCVALQTGGKNLQNRSGMSPVTSDLRAASSASCCGESRSVFMAPVAGVLTPSGGHSSAMQLVTFHLVQDDY
ncbi:uncharacterized protein V6R79_011151 [Siganus canaliculatus]